MPLNYRIYLLSAASLLGYAEQTKKDTVIACPKAERNTAG